MIVLGIDHATRTGWASIDTNTNTVIKGFFTVIKEGTTGDRLNDFEQNIRLVIKQRKPDVICTERPMHHRNGSTTNFLMGLYSVILLEASKQNIEVIEMYPTSVKKLITGNGSADKSVVAMCLSRDYDISIDELAVPKRYKKKIIRNGVTYEPGFIYKYDYDESDALALAHAGRVMKR